MIRADRLAAVHAAEVRRYRARHAGSAAQAAAGAPHFLFGLPLHWMRDWPLPHPLVVERAAGSAVWCVDGHRLADFCLGDTGAMFGHDPPPLVEALRAQAGRGLTAMLPGDRLAAVGAALSRTFGQPVWQLALSASDANRFVLRWARAATRRPRVLVFDGCYHGTVADTLVGLDPHGQTAARASLLGQVHDLGRTTVAVPFNDLDAVEAALTRGDVACVLTEPALTNCGLVPPRPGFLDAVQAACRRHGTLLVLDETHTVSTAHGGAGRAWGLTPDAVVVGKAIAGGVPCAAYGFSAAFARAAAAAKAAAPDGHSGIGTTLAGSLLALTALEAVLDRVMTRDAYDRMDALGGRLAADLQGVVDRRRLPWCVTRLGARLELQFCATAPDDAATARRAQDPALAAALQLYLLNRGLLLTPFHLMWLLAPCADVTDVDAVAPVLEAFLDDVT